MRTDRVYQLKELNEVEEKKRKGKEVLAEEPQRKKWVSEDDTIEFIKTLKRGEYSIVKQLKKQPAQISRLSLLLSSEMHRDALLKILNEAHVPEGTATKDLAHMVGQIAETKTITFNEDELTPNGTGHTKSLHIVVECKGMIIFPVLIDIRFTLNVCPKLTLSCIKLMIL